jgi:hypothetical protein
MYQVEKIWRHKSNICIVLLTSMGYRCGYVGIQSSHSLYNIDYSQDCEFLHSKLDGLKQSEIGKRGVIPPLCWDGERVTPEILFNVHGGITYAGGSKDYPVPVSEIIGYQPWWFGYDCGHSGDATDLSVVSRELREIEERYPVDGVVRSLEYCISECESLPDQLEALL